MAINKVTAAATANCRSSGRCSRLSPRVTIYEVQCKESGIRHGALRLLVDGRQYPRLPTIIVVVFLGIPKGLTLLGLRRRFGG